MIVGVNVTDCILKSQDKSLELALFLYLYLGSNGQTQVTWLVIQSPSTSQCPSV